jgi:hypothetical protein
MKILRQLCAAVLAAWLDKNLQYPIHKYLPLGVIRQAYTPSSAYGDISGGKVWSAAPQFREAGVSDEVLERLEQWGMVFTDRAARIQY